MSACLLATIPYSIFKDNSARHTFLIIIQAVPGIGTLVTATITEEDSKYNVLKKELLMLES
ncbi:hypothetical protein NQ117_11745 [Paenibacillus sp. SC116]|nr:hypothetical protein [Paenibacillus sp. SC116]